VCSRVSRASTGGVGALRRASRGPGLEGLSFRPRSWWTRRWSVKVRSGGLASAKISRPQLSSGGAGVVIGPMAPDQPGPVPALT